MIVHNCKNKSGIYIEFRNDRGEFNFCPFCGESLTEKDSKFNEKIIKPRIEEIIRFHGILEFVLFETDRIKIKIRPNNIEPMYASLSVLCWILGHPNGESFITNMISTEAELNAQELNFIYRYEKDSLEHQINSIKKDKEEEQE